MNTIRRGGAGGLIILLVLAAPAWAQVELVATDGEKVTVLHDADATPGELSFKRAQEFAPGNVKMRFDYSVRPTRDQGREAVEVFYDALVESKEPLDGLFYAVGWQTRNQLRVAEVKKISLNRLNTDRESGSIKISTAEAEGFLRFYLFRDGKSLAGTERKEAEFAPLVDAIGWGDREAVVRWAGDNGQRKVPFWILEQVARWGDVPTMEALLNGANGSRIKSRDAAGVVIAAAAAGRSRMTELLVKRGAPPDVPLPNGATALCVSAAAHSLETMELLIAAGAEVNRWSMAAYTVSNPLESAMMTASDLEPVELLLRHGAKWPKKGELTTWLFGTVSWRPAEFSELLLRQGADPNVANNPTLLVKATLRLEADLVAALLRAGAKPDAVDDAGRTALMFAAQLGDARVINLLRDAGASLLLTDKDKNIAATWAVAGGHPELVDLLLPDTGLSPEVLSQLLARAALLPDFALADRLIQRGAYLSTAATDLDGALVVAVKEGRLELLRSGLEHGLDANYRLFKAWPLAAVAKIYQRQEIVDALTQIMGSALETQVPDVSKGSIQVLARGRGVFPPELEANGLFGEAKIEVYISPEGTPVLPRVRAASNDVVARAALQELAQWHFNPLPAPQMGWRRLVVPIVYAKENMVNGVIYEEFGVDTHPVRQDEPKGMLNAEEAQQLAWMAFTVNPAGQVIAPRVLGATPEMDDAALAAARGWKFRPAVKQGAPVWAKSHAFVVLPANRLIKEAKTFIPDGVDNLRTRSLRMLTWPEYPPNFRAGVRGFGPIVETTTVSDEMTKANGRWAVLLRLSLDDRGNVVDVKVAASTKPQIVAAVRRAWRNVTFEEFRRDGHSQPVSGWFLETSGTGIDEPIRWR